MVAFNFLLAQKVVQDYFKLITTFSNAKSKQMQITLNNQEKTAYIQKR